MLPISHNFTLVVGLYQVPTDIHDLLTIFICTRGFQIERRQMLSCLAERRIGASIKTYKIIYQIGLPFQLCYTNCNKTYFVLNHECMLTFIVKCHLGFLCNIARCEFHPRIICPPVDTI